MLEGPRGTVEDGGLVLAGGDDAARDGDLSDMLRAMKRAGEGFVRVRWELIDVNDSCRSCDNHFCRQNWLSLFRSGSTAGRSRLYDRQMWRAGAGTQHVLQCLHLRWGRRELPGLSDPNPVDATHWSQAGFKRPWWVCKGTGRPCFTMVALNTVRLRKNLSLRLGQVRYGESGAWATGRSGCQGRLAQ